MIAIETNRAGLAAAAIAAVLAATVVASYLVGWFGASLAPWPMVVIGLSVGALFGVLTSRPAPAAETPPAWGWTLVVAVVAAAVCWPAWPTLLPPGGASDLTHHLMLVDVIERTRHLVDGGGAEAALGEMAHYTPGLHLLVVIAASVARVDAYRVAYPLLAMTIALKAGFLYLIAADAMGGMRGRLPLAVAAVGLVLFAPHAYTLDGFLQAGFFAQVASEMFVVGGWWGLARWSVDARARWMALVGLLAAAVFLVWPIWIGPLMVAVAFTVLLQPRLSAPARIAALLIAASPVALVAALHLSQHAAWLRIAGTSGAVPAITIGSTGALLLALAAAGLAAAWTRQAGRVTVWFTAGVLLQGVALYALARTRGAATPYMAMKMIYLGVYPLAVLAALALARGTQMLGTVLAGRAAWVAALVIGAAAVRTGAVLVIPPPIVTLDLAAAGQWVRDAHDPSCVGYIVRDSEQAYWLHLAVLGQPRSSARTASLDHYTANRAIGDWIEGTAPAYAIALRDLLPGEVLGNAEVARSFGTAVVIRRPGARC